MAPDEMPARIWLLLLVVSVCGGIGGVLFLNSVNVSVTDDDEKYIKLLDAEISLLPRRNYAASSYQEQLEVISRVASYLDRETRNTKLQGIPEGMEREPKDWYSNRTGVCYDLARVTEKILRYHGFDVRHVAVYSTKETGSALISFITRRNPSHAVLEVLTDRGWMLVDPSSGTVGVSQAGDPISARDVHSRKDTVASSSRFHVIFAGPYFLVYGLYSRHGMLYPPFNVLPDVSWTELGKHGCCVNVQQ